MALKFNGKKILKYTGITLLSLILLVTVLLLSLRLPVVQNFIKDKLVLYLEKKIHTKVSLEKVYVGFPNSVVIEKLFLQGQEVDTLLYVKSFDVGLNIPQLIRNKADITSIDLEGVRANVVRKPNGTFNFDYILNAFATKEEEESPSKPFIISLDKIKLKDIGVSFIDQQAKNDINLYFKSFDTNVKTFDLDKNSYAIGDIFLDGLKLKLKQDLIEEVSQKVEEKVDSLNAKKPMQLALSGIKLTNINLDYGDENTKTFALVNFKELSTKVNKLDLEKNAYDVDKVLLSGANINANLFLPTENANKNEAAEPATSGSKEAPLSLLLGQLKLDDVKVIYNNTAIKPTARGIDFNHLNFSKLNLELEDFKMQNGTFAGAVNSAEIQESRGLDIRKFNTDFVYEEQQAFLKDLYLETPKTVLRDEVVLKYNSIQQLTENLAAVQISANIRKSKIGFSDILNLAPDLRNTAPFNKYPNAVLNLDTRLKGSIGNLLIQNFELSGLDRLKVAASGTIKNATDPNKLWFDLKIREVSSSAKTIYNLVPKGTIPSNISLPSFFTINGVAKGTTQNISTSLNLKSTLGNASVKAFADLRRKKRELYDVKANLQNFQVGKIIQNKDLGPITAQISAKGQSFDFKNATADLQGHVSSVVYQNYRYQDMNLKGKINYGVYAVHLTSRDPNANLVLDANGSLKGKSPTVKLNGSIRKLDLHKLGFYAEPMIIAGDLDGDFQSLDPDYLNGFLNLKNFAISDTKTIFPVQEMNLNAVSTDSLNQITLQSQILDFELSGKYKLTQIAGALQETINQYYQIRKPGAKAAKIDLHQHFTFNAKVKNDDLIRKFVPDLKSFETITLAGNFDADSKILNVDGNIPQLTYGVNEINGGTIKISNNADALDYQVHLANFKNESIQLMKVSLDGNVADNVIAYNLNTKDEDDKDKFLIAGVLKSINEATEISLNPDGLKLNYMDWQVAQGNLIRLADGGVNAQNFVLSNDGSEISLQSESESPNSPLNVTLKDFKIETITEMVKKDSLLAKGNINGTAQLRDLTGNMTFNADLNISDLFVYGSPVGNLALKAQNKSADLINADVELTGNNNDLKILGDYNTKASSFDLNLDINRLQMQSLQGFTFNAINNAEGYLSGNLKVSGTTTEPKILGLVKFNDVGLGITQLGSNFKNINDQIDFTNRGIEFDKFKINDSGGNSLVLDGEILTQTYTDFKFNLDVNAKDFKVVDSEKNNDAMMYGILAIDAGLHVRGNLDLPVVDGRIAVTDTTDFTFVLPQSSPTLQEREGIVEFIDQDQIALQKTIVADSLDSQTRIKGMDVSVNIELHREAKMSIIIDKANGDFVKLQGEAELTGGIDPSGKTTLVGVYEVEEGAYELSLSIIKRKFDIQKGSTITWTGEPTAANLDITAVYKTQAAPIDLLQQQISGMTASEQNLYKQRIPFNTLLKLKGELLKPEITFDITTDESNNSVSSTVLDNTQTKLDQLRNEEAEMNKQVFALLLLGRFIGENPFESNSGLSAETMAKQSVSKILSQQLNNLAGNLISGVEMNFDLESTEDYSMGRRSERTDLNLDLSKRLLNDRLKVTVGSNFGLEGDARQNEQMTNIAGDVSLDYNLSEDGRYMLRAYRKNEYQVALQGQIVETGVGFIITLDYDQFKDIFDRSKKQQRRENRQKAKSSSK